MPSLSSKQLPLQLVILSGLIMVVQATRAPTTPTLETLDSSVMVPTTTEVPMENFILAGTLMPC